MDTIVLLTLTGLGLAALYFLVASGLSLVFGLADVLNFAHGLFLGVGAYATWWAAGNLPGAGADEFGFVVAVAFGVAAGTLVAVLVELVLIRPGAPTGRVLAGLRDYERRIGVLGLDPYRFKLVAFTLAGGLAAAGGVVYRLIVGGASAHVTSSELTLWLLVMVVLGGPGTRWGPVIGGILYVYLDHRLVAFGTSDAVDALPAFLSRPLSQPLFVLGTVFILAVYFFPGGLASLAPRLTLLRHSLRTRPRER